MGPTRAEQRGALPLAWLSAAAMFALPPRAAHAESSPWQSYQTVVQRAAEAQVGDNFGLAVALDETLAAISACDAAAGAGRVHVFVRRDSTWSEEPTPLVPRELSPGARFGFALDVSGELVATGAPYDGDTGSAFVFEKTPRGWAGLKLPYMETGVDSSFGYSVAADGDTVVVGAPDADTLALAAGAAYVFVRDGSGWKQQGPALLAADEAGLGERENHQFGFAVTLKGNVLVASALGEAAAYVFERTGSTWKRTARLTQSDPQYFDEFGVAVSVYGKVIAVGADLHDDTAHGEDAGLVYVYRRSEGAWASPESERVNGVAGWAGGAFGFRLSLAQGGMIAGASSGDPGNTAYFLRDRGHFEAFDPVTPEDLKIGDVFGRDVAMAGQGVLVGVPNWYGGLGSARFFGLPLGDACDSSIDCVQAICADHVCCDTACSGGCETCLAEYQDAGADGVCGLVSAGKDPHAACSPARCSEDGLSETPAATCGVGACIDAVSRSCAGFACRDGQCLTDCDDHDDCDQARGFSCSKGACSVPLGGACLTSDVCESGYCSESDGVCCDRACDGRCESCLAAKKGAGRDGTCAPIPDGSDPDQECEADASGGCRATGDCDGAGDCRRFAASSVSCGVTTCSGQISRGRHCSGEGDCVDADVDCGAYRCSDGNCPRHCADHDDCTEGSFCGAGSCLPARANGVDCGADHECESGQCAGGECASADRCSRDGYTRIPLRGKPEECAPFVCRAGDCLKICAGGDECAAEFDCNPTNHLCEQVQSHRGGVSGCSTSAPSLPGGQTMSCLLLAVPLVLRARRHRATSSRVHQRTKEQR